MKYEEIGNFTVEQRRLAKQISKAIKKLRDSGCTILAKSDSLQAYTNEDMEHRQENLCCCEYRIPNIDCGTINDAGADDEEYFEDGYITE